MTRLIVFLTLFTSVLGGLHYYLWIRLGRDTALPPPYRAVLAVTLIVLAASIPIAGILGRQLRDGVPSWLPPLQWTAFAWMGVLLLLLVAVAATDLLKGIIWAWGRIGESGTPAAPERRMALARMLGAGAGGSAALAAALGIREAASALRVKEVPVTLPKLNPSQDGMTIVQLTDIHFGPTIGRAFCEAMVAKVNALKPDLIAITGDLVDGSVEDLQSTVEPLRNLQAKHGVYFVTGNHEYYSGVQPWLAELTRLGIRVLRNERIPVGGKDGIDLVGVDDYKSAGFGGGHGPDLARAMAGRDPARPVVLLAHQPKEVERAREHNVDLQLSGHTHAGQIWPWGYLVRLTQPFIAGLNRSGPTQVYVSAGTGYWGPPMRVGTQAEITRISLRSARPADARATT